MVEHKLVSFAAVAALWNLLTLLIKLICILLKRKYIQDKKYAILASFRCFFQMKLDDRPIVSCLIYLLKYCVVCFSLHQADKASQGNEQSRKRLVLKSEKELMLL